MNGIEKITGRIEADAQKEIDALTAQAKSQAEEITRKYAEQAKRESEEIVERGRRNADERVERLASVAQLDAGKMVLGAKQEMLARAFDLALEKLCALPEAEYVDLLANLAVKAARTGKEEVILSQKDRTQVGKAVVTKANELLDKEKKTSGQLTLSEKTRPIQGGLLLSDGAVEVNCTFETLVRLKKTEMAGEVVAVLFQ